jgi:hypothetical protein
MEHQVKQTLFVLYRGHVRGPCQREKIQQHGPSILSRSLKEGQKKENNRNINRSLFYFK